MIFLILTTLLFLGVASGSNNCLSTNKQCRLTKENLKEFRTGVKSVEECSALCGQGCNGFTFFDEEAKFLSNACLLFNECGKQVPCENCVTGTDQISCTCSVPYEGRKDEKNIVDLLVGVRDEISCKHKCHSNSKCVEYTYYDSEEPSRPNTCVLMSSSSLSAGHSTSSCENCATGSPTCHTGKECQIKLFTAAQPLLIEKSGTIKLIAPERDCYVRIKAMAIGPGGDGGSYGGGDWGRGGGSGYPNSTTFRMTSTNPELKVTIGSTTTSVISGDTIVLTANGGESDYGYGEAAGYSGGGGIDSKGGFDGGDGKNGKTRHHRHPKGGKGSGINISELSFGGFVLTPGKGGPGVTGGGGGGILVNGKGPTQNSYDDGEGYGAGGGDGKGLHGCVMFLIE